MFDHEMKASKFLDVLAGVITKFVCASLFGGIISCVAWKACWWWCDAILQYPWFHVFWIFPVVWGFLGIFWFDRMLSIAQQFLERIFDSERY